MCCGSKRRALINTPTPTRAPSTPPAQQSASARAQFPGAPGQNPAPRTAFFSGRRLSPSVILHYTETSAIRVRGPVTGRQYNFSGTPPAQAVDARDAAVLTRSGLFRRAPAAGAQR